MKSLRNFIVSPATAISFLILPFVVGLYYYITIYTDRFINRPGATFFDVQSTILTSFFLEQKWIGFFNRFMDFALWGMLAAVVIIGGYLFSGAKVAVQNHYTEESFVHFKVPKNSWHGHFIVVAVVKFVLITGMIYCLIAFVGQAMPLLAINIGNSIQNFTTSDLIRVVYIFGLIVLLQYIFVVCFKLFRSIHTD
jgi:hypothetical protein